MCILISHRSQRSLEERANAPPGPGALHDPRSVHLSIITLTPCCASPTTLARLLSASGLLHSAEPLLGVPFVTTAPCPSQFPSPWPDQCQLTFRVSDEMNAWSEVPTRGRLPSLRSSLFGPLCVPSWTLPSRRHGLALTPGAWQSPAQGRESITGCLAEPCTGQIVDS